MDWVALARLARRRARGGPGRRHGAAPTRGCVRENYAGRAVAFPLGAVLVARLAGGPGPAGAARRPRRRSTCSTRSCAAGSPTWSASPSSASSTTRSGAARRRTRRAAGAGTPRAVLSRAALDRRDQGGRRARARRLRDLGPGPRGARLPGRPRAAAARDEPRQPARPAARAGSRRRCVAGRRRALPRLLDARAGRAARPVHRPGRWSAPGSRCASGRCSATPARTWSAR